MSPSFNNPSLNLFTLALSLSLNSFSPNNSFFSASQYLTFSITNISFSFNPSATFIASSLTPSSFIEFFTNFIVLLGNNSFKCSNNISVDTGTFTSISFILPSIFTFTFTFGSKCINNTKPLFPF